MIVTEGCEARIRGNSCSTEHRIWHCGEETVSGDRQIIVGRAKRRRRDTHM